MPGFRLGSNPPHDCDCPIRDFCGGGHARLAAAYIGCDVGLGRSTPETMRVLEAMKALMNGVNSEGSSHWGVELETTVANEDVMMELVSRGLAWEDASGPMETAFGPFPVGYIPVEEMMLVAKYLFGVNHDEEQGNHIHISPPNKTVGSFYRMARSAMAVGLVWFPLMVIRSNDRWVLGRETIGRWASPHVDTIGWRLWEDVIDADDYRVYSFITPNVGRKPLTVEMRAFEGHPVVAGAIVVMVDVFFRYAGVFRFRRGWVKTARQIVAGYRRDEFVGNPVKRLFDEDVDSLVGNVGTQIELMVRLTELFEKKVGYWRLEQKYGFGWRLFKALVAYYASGGVVKSNREMEEVLGITNEHGAKPVTVVVRAVSRG